MPLFYVYKKEFDRYSENQGWVVIAKDWKTAKGIALADTLRSDEDKKNIEVKEIDMTTQRVVCSTNYVK